jgi:hypothetical protein
MSYVLFCTRLSRLSISTREFDPQNPYCAVIVFPPIHGEKKHLEEKTRRRVDVGDSSENLPFSALFKTPVHNFLIVPLVLPSYTIV